MNRSFFGTSVKQYRKTAASTYKSLEACDEYNPCLLDCLGGTVISGTSGDYTTLFDFGIEEG